MILKGQCVSKGKSLGTILFKKEMQKIEKEINNNVDEELSKYYQAKDKSIVQIQELYKKALESSDGGTADIFLGHEMLIDDMDFVELIENYIKNEKYSAKYSIYVASHDIREIFLNMESDYMKERASDITDVASRIIMNLVDGEIDMVIEKDKKYIFVGEELFASDTLKLDKENLAGFITRRGSYSAHSGILARTLNIPSMVGVDIEQLENGMTCLIDGDKEEVIINPSAEVIKEFYEYKEKMKAINDSYTAYKDKHLFINGKQIEICGNIGDSSEADEVFENGGEGIGLFRSEFLFIKGNSKPSEEEQFLAYKSVLEKADGKRVVVRTIDIGSDKKASYIDIPEEENPALGLRGIRVCFKDIELFKTQLKALIRASNYGKLAIMFPMIISCEEVLKIKNIITQIKDEFISKNIPFSDFEVGVMIETPASVIISDLLAKEVDFFSIGTNDLTQYTLAVDRMNENVQDLYEYDNIAINRMIKHIIDVAHENGIWAGVCGESASRFDLAIKYIEMGIDELSITPNNIPKMKSEICQKYNI